MGGTGVRIGSDGSDGMEGGGDLAHLAPGPDLQTRRVDDIMRAATWGEDLSPYLTPGFKPVAPEKPGLLQRLLTPSPWEGRVVDSLFGPGSGGPADLESPPAPAPPMPAMERYQQNDQAASDRRGRITAMAKSIKPPTTAPQGPALAGNAKGTQRPGLSQKTALPLYFAKAMGYAVPGESGDEEEARFARAAHAALLKMTKGMSVARFLQGHQSPKTRDTFGRLLDAELAKGNKASPSVVDTPNPALATTSRLPLQPSGG
jgi:hypothetical protein